MTIDLEAVSQRYGMARLAGRDMDPAEGGGEITRAKVDTIIRSWQDVWHLAEEVKVLRAQIANPPKITDLLDVEGRVVVVAVPEGAVESSPVEQQLLDAGAALVLYHTADVKVIVGDAYTTPMSRPQVEG